MAKIYKLKQKEFMKS